MDVFTALADPVRRALLRQLVAGEARVVDLAARFPISRPAVSRHLALLTAVGLVAADDRGRERHYRLVPEALGPAQAYLAALQPAPPVTATMLDALELEVRRTVRDQNRPADAPPADRREDSA